MSRQENPVDHVLDRMVETVLGANAHFKSHAEALGIPLNTIRTWKRRREVPPGKLAEFARDWKVSVDWLLHGVPRLLIEDEAHHASIAAEPAAPYGLSDDERKLLDNYRKSPPEVRETLQLVASIASRPFVGLSATAKTRAPRHGGEVEPVSHGSVTGRPGRKRTPHDSTQ